MRDTTQTETAAPASTPASATASSHGWRVRPAREDDLEPVIAAVGELLVELGSVPPAASAMRETARALIGDPEAGAVLVAEADGTLVGVLVASWQMAMHVPGTYALIQDLWVRPQWRGRAIGAGLVEAIAELARGRGVGRVEVGLPRE
ncbi:MAG TPA: GNAT family N-acetyltransferase, partial [Solirubrobacteraceae bacterium]|nr:GNAT family N-acetyltransferase [Solirubrobacteraceae bacterium]